jgi:CHAT domain-containing protein
MAAQPKDEPGFDGGLERKYLGLMRGLTRQLRTSLAPPPEPPPPQGHILRVLLVADTCREFPLPGAQIEATRLLELFEAVNKKCGTNRIVCTPLVGPAEATALNVLMQINEQPSYDVLHYAGHCFFDREKPSKSGYLFSGGDVLNAGDLRHIDRTPKFVFSNACESGVLPSRADLRSPELAPAFAEAFFAKGVANFVCTAWPISDKAALDFAVALYSQLLGMDGAPCVMWQALREARRSIANTLTWGAYQHYGNPYFQLLR